MSWNTALTALGVNRHCTRIEIKPHTRAGVNEAVGNCLDADGPPSQTGHAPAAERCGTSSSPTISVPGHPMWP